MTAHAVVRQVVPASAEATFALLHDYRRRLTWDTLLRSARTVGDVPPGPGVEAVCAARWRLGGLSFRTRYVTYRPPLLAAVVLVGSPPLFATWAASVRHRPLGPDANEVVYTLTFTCRPRRLARVVEPVALARSGGRRRDGSAPSPTTSGVRPVERRPPAESVVGVEGAAPRQDGPIALPPRQVRGMLTGMSIPDPVNLTAALATFSDVYSPRIVARMNDHDVRVAHTLGEHVWHVHEDTDEFFLVLDGQFNVSLRDDAGRERTVVLRQGDTFVVPKGTEHKPSSPGGAILMFEPSGTSTTGDRHDGAIPDHVDSTTGHAL